MRMMPILAIVVSLGLSMMVLGGLGVSDYFGDGGQVGLEDEIEDQAQDQNSSIDPEEGEDGGFLSFVVSGLGQIRSLMGLTLFLPSTLESMGAPTVVARALGHGTQLVILVGLVQIAIQFRIQ